MVYKNMYSIEKCDSYDTVTNCLKCNRIKGYCIILGIYIIDYYFLSFLYKVVVGGLFMWKVAHLSLTEDAQT